MAKKETKKSEQNELIENPEVIAEKLVPGEDFLKSIDWRRSILPIQYPTTK
jgi:hypothetical protein